MGDFVKGRCPVCGWQLSPKVWRRRLADSRLVGLLLHSAGKNSITAGSPLSSPEQLDGYDLGLFAVMVGRLLDAVGNWVRWRWLPIKDVLNVLPVHVMSGGVVVLDYERMGKRPVERSAFDYEGVTGRGGLLFEREVKPIKSREVKSYGG